jgi:chromosome partitioning protein
VGRVIAVVNQKGGVGKTTTTISLAAALSIAERPTLLIDADPQANSTRSLGFDPDPERASLYDALIESIPLEDLKLVLEDLPHLSVIPSDGNLVGAEVELVGEEGREYRLKQLLEVNRDLYETILIDCPPSLNLLTLNALAAADAVLVPVQCEFLALEGISQLMNTISLVRESLNPELEIAGVVMTMYDDRTNLSRQVVEEVRNVLGDKVYQTVIPRNIRIAEAPSYGQPIFLYDIRSRGAKAYLDLAKEFVDNEEKGIRQRATQSDSASTPAESAENGADQAGREGDGERFGPAGHRPNRSEPGSTP